MKKQRLLFIFFSAALLLCGSVILSLPKDSYAAAVSLPATGQAKCYDTSGTQIACTGTGQDGDKKTGVAWPNPRFTVSGDCVTDNLTGLVWTKNANLPTATKTWQEALDYVKSLNAGGGLCGQTDWRLPQILELESLVHEGYNNVTCGASACSNNAAWLNTQGFINAQSDDYWSSSNYAYTPQYAWSINMFRGYVGHGHMGYIDKSNSHYVWPVQGGQNAAPAEVWKTGQTKCYDTSGAEIACAGTGQDGDKQKGVVWPTPRFTDNGNGTVTDNLTGLIWLKNANCFNKKTWQDALTASNSLANGQCGLGDGSKAGDWRLSNRKELFSLVDFSNYAPALPADHPFTNVQWSEHWTSSTGASSTGSAWYFIMGDGTVDNGEKSHQSGLYFWPVRGGQSGPSSQNNCAATLSNSFLLHEPYFTINGSFLSLDLQYAQNSQFPATDIMFKLANAGVLTNLSDYSNCQASALSVKDNKYVLLHIPIFILGGTSYWLDLTYVPTKDGLLWFKLTGMGETLPLIPEALDIKHGTAPIIDGVFSSDEWSDANSTQISIEQGWTVQVYYKHDASNLYVAFTNLIHNGRELYPEVVLDTNNGKTTLWNSNDWWFHASYNDCEGNGQYNVWDSCQPTKPGWSANNFPQSPPGVTEMKISYAKLGLVPSNGKLVGIAFDVTDTNTKWNFWPSNAKLENPSTWAVASSSDEWK